MEFMSGVPVAVGANRKMQATAARRVRIVGRWPYDRRLRLKSCASFNGAAEELRHIPLAIPLRHLYPRRYSFSIMSVVTGWLLRHS